VLHLVIEPAQFEGDWHPTQVASCLAMTSQQVLG
jgi:hypothetical protein